MAQFDVTFATDGTVEVTSEQLVITPEAVTPETVTPDAEAPIPVEEEILQDEELQDDSSDDAPRTVIHKNK